MGETKYDFLRDSLTIILLLSLLLLLPFNSFATTSTNSAPGCPDIPRLIDPEEILEFMYKICNSNFEQCVQKRKKAGLPYTSCWLEFDTCVEEAENSIPPPPPQLPQPIGSNKHLYFEECNWPIL